MDMEAVDKLMRHAVTARVFPGAVLLVSCETTVVFLRAYGLAHFSEQTPMSVNTAFDLASLTKPLATTLAMMRLVQDRKLDLDDTLGELLPEFRGSGKDKIKLKHLLYHNAGLADYRPYYKQLDKIPLASRRDELRRLLVNEPLIQPSGKDILYSDLGFMILAWVVEHVTAQRLDYFVTEEFYRPLGLENLYFIAHNSDERRGSFAATENCAWRREIVIGRVHDENAFAVGGVEGHAGLFGTAEDVHHLLAELLRTYHGQTDDTLFDQDVLHQFFKRLPGTDKAMGFDMPRLKDASCGQDFSANSVGHLGFTGTSFWMDLEQSVIVILLTNRVHPTRENERIKKFRPHLHNTIMNTLGS